MIECLTAFAIFAPLAYLAWVAWQIRQCARWHRQAIQRKVSYK
jgi:hypothetical protein